MTSMLFTIALFLISFRGTMYYEIPQFVYDACSYSDICNMTSTKHPPPGKVSCCTSCSCHEECGQTLDCCFDSLDKYNLVEKGLVSCVPTAVLDPEYIRGHAIATYIYMVTSCAYSKDSNQSSDSDKCEWNVEESVNDTYLIAPVTDVNTNVTYVHEACAKCNNVHSFVNWNYFYTAQYIPGSDHGSTIWAIESSVGKRLGVKYFVPPKSIRKAVRECFPKLKDRSLCEESSEEYETCEMLNLPLRQVSYLELLFKNVACYSCATGKDFITTPFIDQTCPDRTWPRNFYSNNKLTVLIDIKVIEASLRSKDGTRQVVDEYKCQQGSIHSQLKDRCLQIHCPEGMVKNGDHCKYLFVFWHVAMTHMQVKLIPSPETMLPVSIIKALTGDELKNSHNWLKVPCKKLQPLLFDIYYENASLDNVKSLIVRLHKLPRNQEFYPSTDVPLYEKCAKEAWLLQFGNKKYKFIPELDAHFDYVQDGRTHIYWQQEMTELVRPKLYDVLKEIPNENIKSPFTILKKTFFCPQIRLPLDEVEVGIGQVRILWTNKTLGNNEFYINDASILDSTSINDSSVSMCVDDYVPSKAGCENWPFRFKSLLGVNLAILYIMVISLELLRV